MDNYTLAPLTVADVWDSKVQRISDDELPFFLLSRLIRKDGQPVPMDEFRALTFDVVGKLMGELNLGNGQRE